MDEKLFTLASIDFTHIDRGARAHEIDIGL